MGAGGKRENAGRKSKSEEQQLIEKLSPMEPYALSALKKAINNPKAQSWAIPLYFGYMYGKPKQSVEVTTPPEPIKGITFSE